MNTPPEYDAAVPLLQNSLESTPFLQRAQYLTASALNVFFPLTKGHLSNVNRIIWQNWYSAPCDLRPLYLILTISCILRPDISDTTHILSINIPLF